MRFSYFMVERCKMDRLVREPEVVKILSISRSSWWLGVKEGRFPQPVKLGKRTTCWRLSDIMALFAKKDEG